MRPEIQKEIERLKNIKGEARGVSLKDDFEYVLRLKGKERLRALEQTLEQWGFPLRYKEIKGMAFYPLGLEGIVLLALKETFSFSNEEFEKIGEIEAKQSLVVKLFMKYLISIDIAAKEAPRMWRKYYTVGRVEVRDLNKKEGLVILRIQDFGLSPLHCHLLKGYFSALVQMVVNKPTVCEERKCIFSGDSYHEFFIKWKQK